MAFDPNNAGHAFKNNTKTDKHPNWPDYSGDIYVNGKRFYISIWERKLSSGSYRAGDKALSMSIKEAPIHEAAETIQE